jgi:hypothetical protein
VRVRCLEEVLAVEAGERANEITSMFGGLSPQERVRLVRERRRRVVAV